MNDTYSALRGDGDMPDTAMDYRQYDRIWQRVSPDLNPYPQVRMENGTGSGDMEEDGLENLPGAERDPCCMGSTARDSLRVLEGFIEDEVAGRCLFLRLACRAKNPGAARILRRIAGEMGANVKRLMAAYYLTTGDCYRHSLQIAAPTATGYCAALRSAYHEVACMGFNYMRTADGTADLCLQKLFEAMGEGAYRHGELLLQLLANNIC